LNKNKIQLENLNDFESDAIITIGTRVCVDNQNVKKNIDRTMAKNNASFIYMHPIDDISLQDKYTQYIKYEAGSEEGVFALLAAFLIDHATTEYKKNIEDLDIGYLSGETSVGEEELEQLSESLEDKKNITLIIGEDIYGHENIKNIINFIRLIDMYSDIHVVLLGEKSKIDLSKKINLAEVSLIHTFNGTVLYTIFDESLADTDILKGSSSFATAAKIQDGDNIDIKYDSETIKKRFVLDESIRGTFALYPLLKDEKENTKIGSGYRFKRVQIQKVNS